MFITLVPHFFLSISAAFDTDRSPVRNALRKLTEIVIRSNSASEDDTTLCDSLISTNDNRVL